MEKNVRRCAKLGKTSVFDGGNTLAQRVDLHDVCAAAHELIGHIGQLVRRAKRLFKQGRAAAGDQQQNRILLLQRLDQCNRPCGGIKGVLVGDGMPGLPYGGAGDRPHVMPVFGDDDAFADGCAERFACRVCHLPSSFAERNQNQPAFRLVESLKRAANGGIGQNRLKRCLHDLLCVFSHIHFLTLSFSAGRQGRLQRV